MERRRETSKSERLIAQARSPLADLARDLAVVDEHGDPAQKAQTCNDEKNERDGHFEADGSRGRVAVGDGSLHTGMKCPGSHRDE